MAERLQTKMHRPMTFLLIGAAGFIGSHLVPVRILRWAACTRAGES